MNKEKEYEPFGAEWEKEMMKFSKKDLIALLRRLYKQLNNIKMG